MTKMKNREKEERAGNLRSLLLQDRFYIKNTNWSQAVVREIAEFPGGRNDDIVDAMAVVAKELHNISAPRLEHTAEPKPILGSFQMKDGQLMTTQTLEELSKETLNLGRMRRI